MPEFDLSKISRIVVRGTNWVGDTVMSIPALRNLRRLFPEMHITVWATSGLAPLIKATEVPDDLICFDASHGGALVRPFRMRRELARGQFGMMVLFQNAFESAFTSALARIPLRIGFPTDLRGPLLNVKVPLTEKIRKQHQVFYYLAITEYLANLVGNPSAPRNPDCSVRIPAQATEEAMALLSSHGISQSADFFCLCPGSVNSEAKRWPRQNFANLADRLQARGQVVFLGAPGERDIVDDIIREMHSPAVNLAGRSDILHSMAIMNLSRFVISNDTGSAHLAVASSARVLTIFGPTIPGATAPYGEKAHIVQGSAQCAPCRHFTCPHQNHPCMNSITPENVLRELERLIG
ncbi:lipopolysaccharide heptosyltransferase II [Desulfomonile tiedjei]|uniref:lipopolysaccharide heptosyltransferase II n=1 Tax=Desulfomonile tiedjei (strain ATCC 49306 / DSM 6799 / DCB-1) TaxID=706587 RepID=I4C7H4_DESTA|nr:lipopolysaccharide heptosyltransferase II [Desulfomonile tiedjei]AFM25515.1 lipopolysaccharide heptosyltransferase II [Desulfomonile tiedjei DSM 6799]